MNLWVGYFSWVQFKTGIREKEKTGKGDRQEVTELSASPKGIRISSPVLGVIILTISLLFFYLYLVYVFPIEEIL